MYQACYYSFKDYKYHLRDDENGWHHFSYKPTYYQEDPNGSFLTLDGKSVSPTKKYNKEDRFLCSFEHIFSGGYSAGYYSYTEDVSAVALVSTTLKWLLDKSARFIFATHLHNLPDVSIIKNNQNLSIKHMAVECNTSNDMIEFTREIKDGKGDVLYGVEIAKVIIDDNEFIKQAYKCRNEVLKKHNKLLSTKKSRYNSSLFVDCCEFPDCESKENLDSHHQRVTVWHAGALLGVCVCGLSGWVGLWF